MSTENLTSPNLEEIGTSQFGALLNGDEAGTGTGLNSDSRVINTVQEPYPHLIEF